MDRGTLKHFGSIDEIPFPLGEHIRADIFFNPTTPICCTAGLTSLAEEIRKYKYDVYEIVPNNHYEIVMKSGQF